MNEFAIMYTDLNQDAQLRLLKWLIDSGVNMAEFVEAQETSAIAIIVIDPQDPVFITKYEEENSHEQG